MAMALETESNATITICFNETPKLNEKHAISGDVCVVNFARSQTH